MSGEKIYHTATPVVALSAAGAVKVGEAGVRGGVGIARGIRARIEREVERAREAAAEERRRAEAWRQEQAAQREQMDDLRQQLASVSERLEQAKRQRRAPPAPARRKADDRMPRYLETVSQPDRSRRAQEQSLGALRSQLDDLPADRDDLPGTPFQHLREQAATLEAKLSRRERVSNESIANLELAIHRTIEAQQTQLAQRRSHQVAQTERAQHLLERASFLRHATHRHAPDAEALERQVKKLMADPTDIGETTLDDFEARLDQLKSDVEKTLYLEAMRPELAHAITANLEEMGYEDRLPFADPPPDDGPADAAMAIPGGMQVAIRLTETGRLAFQVRDEQGRRIQGQASAEWIEHARSQEQRWRNDVDELIRRLAGQGFACALEHEQHIAFDKLEVARMETPDEWRTAEAKEDEDERRPRRNRNARRLQR